MEIHTFVRHLGPWPAGKGPLQQKLAHAIQQAIRNGTVLPGMRLPSERSLCWALKVSRTTVVAAYNSLREKGWAESRLGSGTWVSERSRDVAAARESAHAGAADSNSLFGLLGHGDEEMV